MEMVSVSELKDEVKYSANHRLRALSARMKAIVLSNLPLDLLQQEVDKLHLEIEKHVRLVNDL